jgi:uncharacterized protein (TIGR00369 family)
LTSDAGVAAGSIRIGGRRITLAPHNCFACGTLNVHGLQLDLHAGDDRCWTELVLPERFEGWDGMAHGGIVCTILDEVMAWSFVDRDIWAVTARMSVEFRHPVRIGRRIRAEGRVLEIRRRIIGVEGTIVDAEDLTLLARSEATYVGASEARKAELKVRYGFRLDPDGEAPAEEAVEPPGVVDQLP